MATTALSNNINELDILLKVSYVRLWYPDLGSSSLNNQPPPPAVLSMFTPNLHSEIFVSCYCRNYRTTSGQLHLLSYFSGQEMFNIFEKGHEGRDKVVSRRIVIALHDNRRENSMGDAV